MSRPVIRYIPVVQYAEASVEAAMTFLPSYDACYVCGQQNPHGLRVRFFAGSDSRVHVDFRPDGSQTGYDGVVHGGVISALLDELTGWSVSLKNNLLACTAELSVRFITPMPSDRLYRGTAGVTGGRGRYWEAEGSVSDPEGRVYAKARGKYLLFSREQTLAMAGKMTYQPGDLDVFRC
jgi:uncharacterized protein (TIGR00369 family)